MTLRPNPDGRQRGPWSLSDETRCPVCDCAGAEGALRARVAELEAWQVEVAEGVGYINRAEGQSGYEVAPAATIVRAWKGMDSGAEVEDLRAQLAAAQADGAESVVLVRAARTQLEAAHVALAEAARHVAALVARLESHGYEVAADVHEWLKSRGGGR